MAGSALISLEYLLASLILSTYVAPACLTLKYFYCIALLPHTAWDLSAPTLSSSMQPPLPPEPLFVLRGHRAAVQCASFTPNCRVLAAGDAEGELKLWDLDSRRATDSIRAHETHAGVLQVACPNSISTGHSLVISQGRDSVVKCWQVHSGSSLSRAPIEVLPAGSYNFCRFALLEPGQTSSSCSLPQAPAGSTAATAANGDISPDDEGLQVIQGFEHAASSTVRENTRRNRLSGQERLHSAHGLLAQQLQHQQAQQLQQDTAVTATQLEHTAAAGAASTQLVAGTLDTGWADLTEDLEELLVLGQQQRQQQRRAPHVETPAAIPGSTPHSAATGADHALGDSSSQASHTTHAQCWLALPAADAADVGIWQLGQSKGGSSSSFCSIPTPAITLHQERSRERPSHGLCMAVALLHPQGLAIHALTGYEDGSVALWDIRNPSRYLASARWHSESIMCLAVAASCQSGFSGAADESLAAFDLSIASGKLAPAQQLALPGKPGVSDVAIRPDGRIAASAGWDGKIRVWHARKRQPLATLRWHSQQVACVTFSSDGKLLAAGARDNSISMWSLYPPARCST